MSEATMAEVFGAWWSDRPAFIAVKLAPGADPVAVRQELNKSLIGRGEVITIHEFELRERAYWSRETPVGYITDLGFVMGLMIGMVFIYYAQYQIIRFYLPEYAILKSLGYNWWFFLFMIGQIGVSYYGNKTAVLDTAGWKWTIGDDDLLMPQFGSPQGFQYHINAGAACAEVTARVAASEIAVQSSFAQQP